MALTAEHAGAASAEQAGDRTWWSPFVRPKQNIPSLGLGILIVVGCVPLVMVLCRYLGLPGVSEPTALIFAPLRALGVWLNQNLTLLWVPPADRPTILYLLLLPTGALMVALARLTFGLRILGFRAILIAIGFQIAGVVPSLILMAIVVSAILLIRPWMRRIRLPLFARIAVILCLASMIMVGALLLAPLLRSEIVWSVAFFPVIIVAMLAEGVARTIASDNAITAAWRAGWTVIAALIIAWACTRPVVRDVALQFPELMLTQLVMIVMIAEFLDLRLLEPWPARLGRLFEKDPNWRREQPIVAVVRNRWNTGVIGRLGLQQEERFRKRSVQHIVDALRERECRVKVLEGDIEMLAALRKLMPPNLTTGLPGGIVMNLAAGVQGNGRLCQVPSMLELAGVAYTGPDPVAQANMTDRYVELTLLRDAGIPVPRFMLLSAQSIHIADLDFPMQVAPRSQPGVPALVVDNEDALALAVSRIRRWFNQDAVVEEVIEGRKIRASLIGNRRLEVLPLLERRRPRSQRKMCPAPLEHNLAERIRRLACDAFMATGCRDYARIDFRLVDDTDPVVVSVRWDGLLARRGSTATSAAAAGYSYEEMIVRILDEASLRYGLPLVSTTPAKVGRDDVGITPGPQLEAQ